MSEANYLVRKSDNSNVEIFSNEVMIRKLQLKDRKPIKHLLGKIHRFTDEERNCALELVDISLSNGEGAKDYEFLVAVDRNNKLYGFISFGDIPLTDGCYDLYWVMCDPLLQNNGIGTKLLNRVIEILKTRGVRKLFAETSSREDYVSAHNFYKKRGFKLIAQTPDFYKVGDDKLVYVKDL